MKTRKKLKILIGFLLLASLSASCVKSTTDSKIFKPARDSGDDSAVSGAIEEGESDLSSPSEANKQKEFLKCLGENPDPVAQDIAEKFEVSFEKVENWYCRGNSFEDITLALMTTRLWEIDTDDVLLAHETKTWDQIWEELEESQQ